MSELIVRAKRMLTDRIAEFELVSRDGAALPGWGAGAHVDFDLGDAGVRSYSLIRWPGEAGDCWRIAVQREEAGEGGSKAMHALEEGAALEVSAPANDFPLVESARPVALIAGGIGVTPILAMAAELQAAGRDFVFHYAGRSRGAMAYLAEAEAAYGAALQVHCDDEAMIDLPALMEGLAGHELYICGPKPMIEAARAAAEAAGVPAERIHVELFTSAAPQEGDSAFEVELASTGDVYVVPPGRTIIEVLEEAGVDVMFDCQRGDCGICQTEVISGTPDHRDVVLSEAERASGKVMQICVSRALSERLVLDL